MQTGFSSSRLLIPARGWFIALSFVFAVLFNLLPLSYQPLLPDAVAFMLCFWGIRETRRVGMGVAVLMGVTMDVAAGSVMGQHVMAYVILVYLAGALSRRVLWFDLRFQALHVLALLMLSATVEIASGVVGGGVFPGWAFLFGPIIGSLLWAPGSFLLLLPQYQPLERDENRPI